MVAKELQKAEMFGGAARDDRGVGCADPFGCACASVLHYVLSPGSVLLTSFLSG